ncbi:MAG: CDP-archaeol synthase [Deltaproteobacteria bacterium]|nr:CDP-archaeol synthase [Deltaproteobacteria bacterium]
MDPLTCAAFLILAFVLAGVAQTAWFRSSRSRGLAIPLDLGAKLRGRRLLGDNKTLRGFAVMLPAAAASFLLLRALASLDPVLAGRLWPLSPAAYALLGLAAGLGFMLGELPNSFLKRQLDIPPGEAAGKRWARLVFFAVDRLDSIAGMLLAVSLLVPTSWQTWAYVALAGPPIHWSFSLALYRLGVKKRPA